MMMRAASGRKQCSSIFIEIRQLIGIDIAPHFASGFDCREQVSIDADVLVYADTLSRDGTPPHAGPPMR